MSLNKIKINDTTTVNTGIVYDISKAHNGETYTNLIDALGTNGINVPLEVREGGMSVKFIQTSDATYLVIKTENLEEPPTGTLLANMPRIDNGKYTAKQLAVFNNAEALPSTVGNSVTYYISVIKIANEQEITTYTTWVVYLIQSSINKYTQWRLTKDEWSFRLNDWEECDLVNVRDQNVSDFDISDQNNRTLVRFKNGHIETKNFDSTKAIIAGDSIYDLEITDENGNSILQSNRGNLRTKNFDSLNTPNIEDASVVDFQIADENEKVIVEFYDGHIKTKNFNSKNISPSSSHYRDYSAANVRFNVSVNANILKNSEDTLNQQDTYVGNYKDNGVLMLPETYTKDGVPTRLVIHFHGGGGGVTDHDSQTETSVLAKYLVANGYAVMDMDGMPANWVESWWSDFDTLYSDDPTAIQRKSYIKANNMGTSLAMECYIKGYQWVIENYNIAKDGVFVFGGSMGGLSSSNFVTMGSVPVLAHAIACPVLDTFNQAFLHAWTPNQFPTGVISRYALSKLYGFSQKADISETTNIDGYDIKLIFNYDDNKVTGYNPILNGMQTFLNGERITSVGIWDYGTSKLNGETVTEYKDYPCPLKIWHCDNDPTVNITVSERHINAIRNAGGKAWLRRFPSGGHDPLSTGSAVANPTGNTILKGSPVGTITPAREEIFLFFNRFNKK